jgi:DhnA family fructose-bisphosphate aldolase class Ia
MIELAGVILSEAQTYDIPVLGIIYPRGEENGADDDMTLLRDRGSEEYVEAVRHCVSLGADLGFDAIKTCYTGSRTSFETVISASRNVPIVIAGGPCVDEEAIVGASREAIQAGAAGVSFGRNIFGRSNPAEFVRRIRDELNRAMPRALGGNANVSKEK